MIENDTSSQNKAIILHGKISITLYLVTRVIDYFYVCQIPPQCVLEIESLQAVIDPDFCKVVW